MLGCSIVRVVFAVHQCHRQHPMIIARHMHMHHALIIIWMLVWGYLVYCMFVCLLFFFVRLRISQQRKKLRAWHFACLFQYYPDRCSPLLMNFGSRGVTAAALLPGCSRNWPPWQDDIITMNYVAWRGHSEMQAAASRKAVWWDLRLASLLTHLLFIAFYLGFCCIAMQIECLIVICWNYLLHYYVYAKTS